MILLLLTGLFNLLLGLGAAILAIAAIVTDGTSNRLVAHREIPTFLAIFFALAALLLADGLVEVLSGFFLRKPAAAIFALLATLLHLLIALAGIVLGILLAINNHRDEPVLIGIISAIVFALLALVLLFQSFFAIRCLTAPRAAARP
jgi:hypothetical protein